MPTEDNVERLNLRDFATRFRGEMIPLGARFAYFPAAVSLTPEDIHENLEDPIASLPPGIASILPQIHILLVPFLARPDARPGAALSETLVETERPSESRYRLVACYEETDLAVLAMSVKEQDLADQHYYFFHTIAELLPDRCPRQLMDDYLNLLKEELEKGVHGEVDERGWQLKQALLHHQKTPRRETKRFREYGRQSFVDTATLYLHGICCDIDVEPGPRQLPSRALRKRLNLINASFPPPESYAVFPEDLK